MNIIIEKGQLFPKGNGISEIPVDILHPEIRAAIEELMPNTEIVYLHGFGPTYIYMYTGGEHPNVYGRITIEI